MFSVTYSLEKKEKKTTHYVMFVCSTLLTYYNITLAKPAEVIGSYYFGQAIHYI